MIEQSNLPTTSFPGDLLVALDRSRGLGLREQLEQQLRRSIQERRLIAGTHLPATRVLASELGIARSVVVEAYSHLVADGYLEARQGSGTRVCNTAFEGPSPERAAGATRPVGRLLGGLPDPGFFPRRRWQHHYRAVLAELPDPELSYPGPLGALALREALAAYLGRVRGVTTTPEHVVITSGFTQALTLLCRALQRRGARRIAVEDPCFALHRQAVAMTGLEPVPIAVDENGLDVARLSDHDVAAVLLSPAHSYPTGCVLNAGRRGELVTWARRHDALIIEDDYDAEFRYDRAPVGALQGLAPGHVLYVGCASKTLAPALRLGWAAAPPTWVDELQTEKLFDDMGSGLLEQLALARLIAGGDFTRHLRRVRPLYRARRDAALGALGELLPAATHRGAAAGLHIYVELERGSDETAIVDAARHRGVILEGGAWHWAEPPRAAPALVLGYGSVAEPAMRHGIAVLAEVCAGLRRRI